MMLIELIFGFIVDFVGDILIDAIVCGIVDAVWKPIEFLINRIYRK